LESDPIGSGLINSFSRPGGQVTGLFFDFPEFSRKWLELLKEAMPQLSSVAVLWDPWTGPMQTNGVEIAAEELNVKLEIFEIAAAPIFAVSHVSVHALTREGRRPAQRKVNAFRLDHSKALRAFASMRASR
jgi:ABC-type uncharacterized transport system substrate-binding protein